jgi:hypothetical protein
MQAHSAKAFRRIHSPTRALIAATGPRLAPSSLPENELLDAAVTRYQFLIQR